MKPGSHSADRMWKSAIKIGMKWDMIENGRTNLENISWYIKEYDMIEW